MRDRGNILFLILLAVVLFAALSYAVTGTMRGDGKNASAEKAQLSAAQAQNYEANITSAITRLKMTNGCTDAQINYEYPVGTNVNPVSPLDKSCNIFHVNGAGVPYQGNPPCSGLTGLSLGQQADCGIVYIGTVNSKRLYVHISDDSAAIQWDSVSDSTLSGANSATNGKANTDKLVSFGSRYPAAALCRSFGEDWYLPAFNEVETMRTNRNAGVLSGTFTAISYYTSQEASSSQAYTVNMAGGDGVRIDTTTTRMRCVRSD